MYILKIPQDCTLYSVQCTLYVKFSRTEQWTVSEFRRTFKILPDCTVYTLKILQNCSHSKFCRAIHFQNSAGQYTLKIPQNCTLSKFCRALHFKNTARLYSVCTLSKSLHFRNSTGLNSIKISQTLHTLSKDGGPWIDSIVQHSRYCLRCSIYFVTLSLYVTA